MVDFLLDTRKRPFRGRQYKGHHLAAEQVTDTIDKIHGGMAQRLGRLTSNQKIGGSNPSVVDFLFDTNETSYEGSQYKGQHLAAEHETDTIDRIHSRMVQRIRCLTPNQKIRG